jgi:hypothetical protein
MRSRHADKVRLQSIASAAVAIALAIFAGSFFTYAIVIWNPGYYGEFGLSASTPDAVDDIVRGSPADKAGIKVGDRVARPRMLHERLLLLPVAPYPGERITLSILAGSHRRSVTLQARPLSPLPVTDRFQLLLKCIWQLIFLAVALALVLLRPTKMTWGFYLFAINLVLVVGPPSLVLSYAPEGWVVAAIIARDTIAPAGVAGFLIFCVRFPTDTSLGWRKVIEALAPFQATIISLGLLYADVVSVLFLPRIGVFAGVAVGAAMLCTYLVATCALLTRYFRAGDPDRREMNWALVALISASILSTHDLNPSRLVGGWSVLGVFMLGTVVVLITYFGATGLERHRIKWVVFGFVCALCATAVDFLYTFSFNLGTGSLTTPPWQPSLLEVLYIALPLSVAYAVIRHRVIDLRFALSRALAAGAFAAIVVLLVLGIDWVFSTRLPASRFEAFVYAGLALLVGFWLNAARQSMGKAIDFLFFRQWYRTQEQAVTIADAMRHATSSTDIYRLLTAGIADAFSLASVALFERTEDGGFVRAAARGWPSGTLWHILPDDALVAHAADSARTVDVETLQWHEHEVPAGVARPTVMLPIASAKRVPAVLLFGSHRVGTALDRDELSAIRRACADAGLIYERRQTPSQWQTDSHEPQTEPVVYKQ